MGVSVRLTAMFIPNHCPVITTFHELRPVKSIAKTKLDIASAKHCVWHSFTPFSDFAWSVLSLWIVC